MYHGPDAHPLRRARPVRPRRRLRDNGRWFTQPLKVVQVPRAAIGSMTTIRTRRGHDPSVGRRSFELTTTLRDVALDLVILHLPHADALSAALRQRTVAIGG
jgi:hypothetical protein